MLIEFSVENFKSFNELQTLQMQAAKIKSQNPILDKENIFSLSNNQFLLKSKAIYGANGSGKSNLIAALHTMKLIILNSFKDDKVLKSIIPFKLLKKNRNLPSFFQIVFQLNGVVYRYGFEANNSKIISEWLFGTPEQRETYYFQREGNNIKINKKRFKEGYKIHELVTETSSLVRPNALFLGVVNALNGKISTDIINWIDSITILRGINSDDYTNVSKQLFFDKDLTDSINDFFKSADLGIEKLQRIDFDDNGSLFAIDGDLLFNISEYSSLPNPHESDSKIVVSKKVYDGVKKNNQVVEFTWLDIDDEAEGTKKLFVLIPLLLVLFKKQHSVIIIDEFDARLHSRLSTKIIELFHTSAINKNNTQLIFATHDTNFLQPELLRRDQICFIEKNEIEASEIVELMSFKGVRNDITFEKEYLKGKYGGVPYLNKIKHVFLQKN